MGTHGRRKVLKYAGLAVAAGGVVPASAAAAADDDGSSGPSANARGWESFRGNSGNAGYAPDEDGPDERAAIDWEYDDGTGPIAVVDDVIYLAMDGAIHAIDGDDGDLLGETDDVGAAGCPAVVDDTLYVGGEGVTALDVEGGEVDWRVEFESDEVPSPTVVDGTVFVVVDGTLYALETDDGSEVWQFDPDGRSLIGQTVTVADGAVFTTDGQTLYAHEIDDGSERWANSDGQFRRQVIVATDDIVSIQAGGVDEVAVYGTESGDLRWLGDGYVSGLATDDYVYTLVQGDIVGYDRETGDEVQRPALDSATYSAPVTDGDTVYVGVDNSSEGAGVGAFDIDSGELEWLVETDTHPQHLAITDGTLYADVGGLVAIRSEGTSGNDESEDADDDSDEPFDGDEVNESEDADETADDNETTVEYDESEEDEASDAGDELQEDDVAADDDESENEDEDEADHLGGTDDSGEDDEGETEEMPGFTAGAGIAGGALALEWLRRQGGVADGEE
jgi:outer membrane protein assembly factor BamB